VWVNDPLLTCFPLIYAVRKRQQRRRQTLVFTFRTFESLALRQAHRVQDAAVAPHSLVLKKKNSVISLRLQTSTRQLLAVLHHRYLAAQISRRPLLACWLAAPERSILNFYTYITVWVNTVTVDNRVVIS